VSALGWRDALIICCALFISFVVGVLVGERKDRPHHTARLWRNL